MIFIWDYQIRKKIAKKFGTQKNQNRESRLSDFFLCCFVRYIKELIIYSNIRRYTSIRKKVVHKGIDKMLGIRYLLVCDRGFPSIGVILFSIQEN